MKARCLLIAAFFLSAAPPTWADVRDGFNDHLKIESRHFTIYYKDGVDLSALLESLKITRADLLLTRQSIDDSSPEKKLASMLDIIFDRTCDILDMHVYSFKGDIKIFPTQELLQVYFNAAYPGQRMPCAGVSFYSQDLKSIYITPLGFCRGILGHEMGHAVISSYFVVSPSIRIQEVLAGYVEYQLKKAK